MAAAEPSGLTFVDEDDLPVAFLCIAHVDSDNEAPSDVDSSEKGESADESGEESNDCEDTEERDYSNLMWSSVIRPPQDRNFNEEVGMRVEMENNSSCLNYFELLFTDNVYQLILNETARCERQKRHLDPNSRGHLHNLTVPELKAWLGLTLAMGLVKKPNLKSYWCNKSVIKTPLFPNTMLRDRYLHILQFMHFVDNNNATDPADPNRDKLWKIRPFLNALLPRFTTVYSPSQNLSVDETLIKFKGCVQFRQFLPLKRSQLGLKGFVVADSATGYVLDTMIYTGKEGPAVSRDLAMGVVLKLVEPYVDKGYRLFVDNWYTSVPLFLELERRGILACGTVRGNRKFLPKDSVDQTKEHVKRLKRGESLFRQNNNLVCVTWKDKKLVHLLSTIPEGLEIGQVERKVRSKGRWQKQNFAQPKVIKMYNSHMGGVDLGDQRIATCSRLMKGNIWCYKIFFHMLEVSALNAHIMYKRAGHGNVTLAAFKEKLVEQLIAGNSFRRDTANNLSAIAAQLPDIRFNRVQFHHPVKTDTHKKCKVHIQRVETVYECTVCQVRMCPAPCSERYHTLQEYLFDDPERNNSAKRLKDVTGRPRAGPGRPPQRRSR